ncbi:thiamine transport system permease protein [Volucribacter psittacicida]|uniref:Thiamine transport system permease protein ThiP n=1 Tax=Volucribacter psittacicida TaxID=203482 RepID=A0A4R1FRL6_9PAST|nr:thiamine/thiamine pyrophosphate ABC transporter permease ThiP [Volucribacter psittacicida]TCJ96099.1 thiamine transport system permease protein [Volucribacter psittacicida]
MKLLTLIRNPQFRPKHYLGGMAVLLLLVLVYSNALQAIFRLESPKAWLSLWDPYLRHVLFFSFAQALLSAILSVIGGLLLARALFYQDFIGKKWLLKLFSLTFVLPSLVVIFGVLGVYGTKGWLAQFLSLMGIEWQPNIYGLTGILLTHLFFNIPFACRLFLPCFQAIPSQQHQLAEQLNLRGWRFIRWVEWAYLRPQILPALSLIFMLCFTSFTIVLTLGGGPQYTTLEVAIYQAIVFDFDLARASFYALLQFVFCFMLFAITSWLGKPVNNDLQQSTIWRGKQKSAVRYWQIFLIISVCLFILFPLFNLFMSALTSKALWSIWQSSQLWRAMGYSLAMALSSACFALLLAIGLLLLSRRLLWLYWRTAANFLLNFGMLILSIPTLLLAIGLFIWLQHLRFDEIALFFIVVLCNGLAAMPFVIRILSQPMNQNMLYYEKLCQSLGIKGWQRLRLIEWNTLAQPIKYAFALAMALSLGDFTAIALFGNQHFTSLPYLLYQQLGSYRGDEAAVTAMILLLFCFTIFVLIERNNKTASNQQ